MDVYHSTGKTAEAAFRILPSHVREILRMHEYRVEPFAERLRVQLRRDLTFQVPGLKGENDYRVEIHEYFDEIGFCYQPIFEIAAALERMAPIPVVQRRAPSVTNRWNVG